MAFIQFELMPLQVPTETYIKRPPGRREDGFRQPEMLALNDLDRDVVLALLDEMHETVMSNWTKARTQGCPR